MNHEEAVKLLGTEQYLLNELSPELREQFEEHFFECAECAADLRAGALFIEQTKAAFAGETAEESRPVVVPARVKQPWFAWLRPAFAVPVTAVLLAVIVYQNWPSHSSPQVLPAAYINVASRGGNAPSVSTQPGQAFLLRMTVPPDSRYSTYSADIYSPDGKLKWSLKLPYSSENDSYFVQVPAGRYSEGIYSVAIRGTAEDGASSEVGRSSFELHISH